MSARLSLSTVAESLTNLPGPLKWIGAALTLGPLLFALLGMGWNGFQTPAKIDAHLAQVDSVRRESAERDSLVINEMREANRLARCSIVYRTYEERLRCAVPQ